MGTDRFQYKPVGFKYTAGPRVVEPAALVAFYEIPGIKEEMFVQDEAGRTMGFQGKIVPAAYTTALVFSMTGETGLAEGAVFLEMNARFVGAVYPNDTLRIEGEVLSKRPTSKGDRLVITYSWVVKNQDNAIVVQGANTELFPNPEKP